jgi:hypothetical protein
MPIPQKETLLGDKLPWAIELQASWQLLEVEILFFIWNKQYDALFNDVHSSRSFNLYDCDNSLICEFVHADLFICKSQNG